MIWIILLIVVAIVATIFVVSRKWSGEQPSEESAVEVTYPPRSTSTGILDDDVKEVFIAGLQHHCTRGDIGPFSGVVFNEKDNPADKNAMAIGDHYTKKIIGYIPNSILSDYRKWAGKSSRPCVGFIFWDGEYLRGQCRVYHVKEGEDMDKCSKDAVIYTSAVAEHFGWRLNEQGRRV